MTDDNGVYHNSGCPTSYFLYDGKNVTTAHRHDDGSFFVKVRVGRNYEESTIPDKDVYILMRCYRKHSFHKDFTNTICRINQINTPPKKFVLVINRWGVDHHEKENFQIACHGNAKTLHATSRPFLPRERNVSNKLRIDLTAGKTPSEAYVSAINSTGGPMKTKSSSEQPRDLKQVFFLL